MTANIFAQSNDFLNGFKEINDTIVINKLKSEISKSFKEIESIDCNYLMNKHIPMLYTFPETKGSVKFKKTEPSELHWSSVSPQQSSFKIKNDSIEFVNAKEIKKIAIEEHPIFREISQIIKSSEKHGSFIDESMFYVKFFKNDNELYINLIPKKNRMKKVIEKLYVKMDYATKIVKEINVFDATNSKTDIKLSDVKITNIQ